MSEDKEHPIRMVEYPLVGYDEDGREWTGSLRVPLRLSQTEADRLCAMIQTIVMP